MVQRGAALFHANANRRLATGMPVDAVSGGTSTSTDNPPGIPTAADTATDKGMGIPLGMSRLALSDVLPNAPTLVLCIAIVVALLLRRYVRGRFSN